MPDRRFRDTPRTASREFPRRIPEQQRSRSAFRYAGPFPGDRRDSSRTSRNPWQDTTESDIPDPVVRVLSGSNLAATDAQQAAGIVHQLLGNLAAAELPPDLENSVRSAAHKALSEAQAARPQPRRLCRHVNEVTDLLLRGMVSGGNAAAIKRLLLLLQQAL